MTSIGLLNLYTAPFHLASATLWSYKNLITIVLIIIIRPIIIIAVVGPSIKYVTLEGEGGPRRCDSL